MKPMMNARSTILVTLVAGATLVTASAVLAESYVAPQPQPRYDEPAHAPAPGAEITLGWHGDRYWDGHRYWEHDEWMHHHPHDRDPQRDREPEDRNY